MTKRTKIFFAAAIIFFSGFFAGAILGHLGPFIFMDFFFRPPPPSPSQFRGKLCEKISKDLKLTEAQKTDFLKKLEPKMEAFAAEHKMIRNAFGTMLDSTIMELQPALTDEQQKCFAALKKEREERAARGDGPPGKPGRHHGGPPPPPF